VRRVSTTPTLINQLAQALGRPEPFAPHDAPFWDDPYIASQMLAAHLDPHTDGASRRPETIRATVDHLVGARGAGPRPGDVRQGAHERKDARPLAPPHRAVWLMADELDGRNVRP
jgi:hypothetical protein